MTEPTRLFLGLKKFLTEHVFNFTGNVSVVNLPETQKVEIINHKEPQEEISVSNLNTIAPAIVEAISLVERAVREIPKQDAGDVLLALERLIIAINEKEIPLVDLSDVLKKLDEKTEVSVDLKIV